MKRFNNILLLILLLISVSLNCLFVYKYEIKGEKVSEGLSSIIGNKYTGHWVSADLYPDLYVDPDGTAYLVSLSSKKATEKDPYAQYISQLYRGKIENDNLLISAYADIYKPGELHLAEDGVVEEYYFHSIDEIPEDKYISTAKIVSIEVVSDTAISLVGLYPVAVVDLLKE